MFNTEYFKRTDRFSFLYDGKPFSEYAIKPRITESGNTFTFEYSLDDGLKVTNLLQIYPDFDACEWVLWFENTGKNATKVISGLYDGDITLPSERDEPLRWEARVRDGDNDMKIFAPKGSDWCRDDFSCDPEYFRENNYHSHIYPGSTKQYANCGGRSSNGQAPFFNIFRQNKGYLFAIGWSGQWNCTISRAENSVNIQTKIADTNFRLYPGEKIRTSSLVVMAYECNLIESQNKWRRFLKTHFSPIAAEEPTPFCAGIWGGVPTEEMLERIRIIKENALPFEYIWIDAGWYGSSTEPCPNDIEGNWAQYTGDWQVNKNYHPDGLLKVSRAVKDAGMKLLLWFEPERAVFTTPIVNEHPEYFLRVQTAHDYSESNSVLLNLGDENAWQYCFDMLKEYIHKLGIDCLRQDFNFNPLNFWRDNDAYDRKGITEIKYIMGLYRLWDSLKAAFPDLLIDNCASGGRRIDIETLRRSLPLWRSDYPCNENYIVNGVQAHNVNFGLWMPISGNGTGKALYDEYRMRSAYSAALTTHWTMEFKTAEDIAWVKKYVEEYLRIRPYFTADIYPITEPLDSDKTWLIVQYNRPEQDDGVLQVFKREHSPYTSAICRLCGLKDNEKYVLTDADTEESSTLSGKKLMTAGLTINVSAERTAKIFFYKRYIP